MADARRSALIAQPGRQGSAARATLVGALRAPHRFLLSSSFFVYLTAAWLGQPATLHAAAAGPVPATAAPQAFSIVSFSADPDTVAPFGSTTLSWEVMGDANVTLDGFGDQGTVGSVVTQPERSRSYTLRAYMGPVQQTAQVRVTVAASGVGPGFLTLSWSPTSIETTPPPLAPYTLFHFWVVAVAPAAGVLGYEFKVVVPPCVQVVDRTPFPPGAWDASPDPDIFIVGTSGSCLSGSLVQLVEYVALVTDAACLNSNTLVDLDAATPSSFVPPAPGYLTCQALGDLRRFMVGPPLSLGQGPTVSPVVIQQFAANRPELEFGQSGTLTWSTANADSVWITPGGLAGLPRSGSVTVSPPSTTTYTLHATNPASAATSSITVGRVPFAISRFSATPETLSTPGNVMLSWEVLGGASVSIDSLGAQPLVGSLSTYVTESRNFILRAVGGGYVRSASVYVWVTAGLEPIVIVSFTARPPSIMPGQSSTLAWLVRGPAAVSLDGIGPQPASGSLVVTPPATRTYVLRAADATRVRTASLQVTVGGPLVVIQQFVANPPELDFGHTGTLSWSTANADSIWIEPGGFAGLPAAGSVTISPPSTTTYTLHATNPASAATSAVTVARVPFAISHFSAAPETLATEGDVLLTWEVLGVASVSIDGLGVLPPIGSTSTHVNATRSFLLRATGGGYTRTASVHVQVGTGLEQIVIQSFTATPSSILPGQSSTLSWAVTGPAGVWLDGIGPQPRVGSLVVAPPATRSYVLRAADATRVRTASLQVTVIDSPAPFTIESFAASPATITVGQSSTLVWRVTGSGEVSVDGIGPQPMIGSLVVTPTTSTTYVLRVQSGNIVRTAGARVDVVPSGFTQAVIAPSWSATEYPGNPPVIAPFTPFNFYIIAIEPTGGILGFEFSVVPPPGVLVTGGRGLSPPGALDVASGDDNFIVGTGGVCLTGSIVWLVSYNGCLFLGIPPQGAVIHVGPSSPSSLPSGPAYLTCLAAGDIRAWNTGPDLPLFAPPPNAAIAMRLRASAEAAGVQLTWSLTAPRAPEQIELLRGEQGGVRSLLVRLTGPQATLSGTWTDADAQPAVRYSYVALALLDGEPIASNEVVATRTPPAAAVTATRLLGASPNPFNPRTTIRFELAAAAAARLTIVDVAGRRVRDLQLPTLEAGARAWEWDGTDDAGVAVGSGVYWIRLTAGGRHFAQPVTLVR